MEKPPNAFFISIPDIIRKRLLISLKIENLQRIYVISLMGLLFFFLFLGLDYIRYGEGKIQYANNYFLLWLNHLCFLLFLIPVLTIQSNRETIYKGRYKHSALLIYTWTSFLGLILLSMAILSLIDRGSLAMYSLYIIITNFGILMLYKDRIFFNILSFLIITIAIVALYSQSRELLIISFLESIGITITCFFVSTQIFNAYVRELISDKLMKEQNEQIQKEKNRADELLYNILPKEIAAELKQKGYVKPRHYSSSTIMLIDFKNFSGLSKALTTQQLIADLDYCFKNFDRITSKFGLEKIKTIGDAYLCVGGVPESNPTHPFDCIEAAREFFIFLEEWKIHKMKSQEPIFEGRIGIHTGPLIAGVVGDKKFAFDVWGDAVNITARVESKGETGKINISQKTYELVRNKYTCTHRGKIAIKGQEPLDMYFVEAS